MFNSNIGPNYTHLRDIGLQNLGDLEFDLSRNPKVKCGLSRSLKVKCNGAIGLLVYGFLFMFNSNYDPYEIRLQNLGDRDLTFQGHSRSSVTLPLNSPYMVSY